MGRIHVRLEEGVHLIQFGNLILSKYTVAMRAERKYAISTVYWAILPARGCFPRNLPRSVWPATSGVLFKAPNRAIKQLRNRALCGRALRDDKQVKHGSFKNMKNIYS